MYYFTDNSPSHRLFSAVHTSLALHASYHVAKRDERTVPVHMCADEACSDSAMPTNNVCTRWRLCVRAENGVHRVCTRCSKRQNHTI